MVYAPVGVIYTAQSYFSIQQFKKTPKYPTVTIVKKVFILISLHFHGVCGILSSKELNTGDISNEIPDGSQ